MGSERFEKQPMLVSGVEVIQDPQPFMVPALVRLEGKHEVDERRGRSLYFSKNEGFVFDRGGGAGPTPDRKSCLIGDRAIDGDGHARKVVERGPEVVRRVARD